MARIMGIDYGLKRCGVSATDPLQIIVSSLDTVLTVDIRYFVAKYCKENEVEKLVIGLPSHKDGTPTSIVPEIEKFVAYFKKHFPEIIVDYQDEAFSSVYAKNVILKSGAKKKKRRDKALVDKVSAVIILQRYLKHI